MEPFILKLVATLFSFKNFSCGFIDEFLSRPQSGVVTSFVFSWCHDIRVMSRHRFLVLDTFFSPFHISSVPTSFICSFDHPGRILFLQVMTSLVKVFYFFFQAKFGDVMTWNWLATKLPVVT